MSEIPFSVRSRRTGASTVNDLGGMNFSTIDDNELLKRVDADNVGGSSITATETSIGGSYNHKIKTFVGSNELASITTAYNSIGNYKNIQFLPDDSILGADGINIQSVPSSTETRVGINVQDPEEALDIEGNLELRGATGKIFFKHPSGLQKVELDGDQDGTNGGKFVLKTKVDGSSMTEKLTVNNVGAIGLGATPTYGSSGQVLTSNGSGSAVSWSAIPNPVPNLFLNVCADTDLKVGNANTGNVNSNTLNAWLPLYTQTNVIRLQQQMALTNTLRLVKIETNVPVLLNQTHVGFRVVCNNGISVFVVPGTTNWKSSAATGDDDTPVYCASVVHTPGGTGTLTYTIEAYVLARNPPNPAIAIFNAGLDPSIALAECTMLLTEL